MALVLEKLDCNLKTFLKEKKYNDFDLLTIAIDVAHGIEYLHQNYVIHKDIKVFN